MALSLGMARGSAQTPLTTLYTFANGRGGTSPSAHLISTKSGTLFGAAQSGGTINAACPDGCGTIFALKPPSTPGEAWKRGILYSFQGGVADGDAPQTLIRGSGGVFYGTTYLGGSNNAGTVFQLTPPVTAGDPYIETILYSFGAYSGDAANPGGVASGLVLSKTGALYGTASAGGAHKFGAVFELAPPTVSGEPWTETLIYSFTSGHVNGGDTVGGILLAKQGEIIYGVVETGGAYNVGFVYELRLHPSGEWVETDIHDFAGGPNDAGEPETTLIQDSSGALYGTSFAGGGGPCSGFLLSSGCGTVFKLAPPASSGGAWTQNILYSFTTASGDGVAPAGSLLFGTNGALFGTTTVGGTGTCHIYFEPGCGTIFELTPPAASGSWTETILYSFSGAADGAYPSVGLVPGANSDLYGTTTLGADGFGTVFQLAP